MAGDRERLLVGLSKQSDELHEVLRALRGRMDDDLGDGWRVRDVLAHLALWERISSRKIAGRPLLDPGDEELGNPWSVDRFNEAMRERWRDRGAAEIAVELDAAHRELVAAIGQLNDDLCAPGGPIDATVRIDGYEHYGVHLADLKRLLTRL